MMDITEMLDNLMKVHGVSKTKREVKCGICNDEGWIYEKDENGYLGARKCKCSVIRECEEYIQNSGLDEFFQSRTFENYKVSNTIQNTALITCKKYVKVAKEKPQNLILAGQVGSGKTHLAAATLMEMAKMGKSIRFINYKDMIRQLSIAAQDRDEYVSEVKKYKDVSILLLDDLFKGNEHRETHLTYLYEVLNHRYNRNLHTIITTEKNMQQMMNIESAITSRIIERARGFIVNMNGAENYRLSGKP